jgi:hypothetical protein
MAKKISGSRIFLLIMISIIFTVLVVALVNIGVSLFLTTPEFDDFCDINSVRPLPVEKPELQACPEDAKTCDDGTVLSRDPLLNCEFPPCKDEFETCNKEYSQARESFNQIRFYIFAIIGFALLIFGIYTASFYQITGLASGIILVIEGVLANLQNKIAVFILLLFILVVFWFIARKILKKKKWL